MAIAPGDYVLGKPERYPVVQVGYVNALRGDYAHVYYVFPDGHVEDYYTALAMLQPISWTPDPPADPVVMALLPDQARSGDPDLTMRVIGTGFTAETLIVFGAYDEPTTLINANEVSTGVKPVLFAPAQVPVKVRQGEEGGPESNALPFTFTGGAAPPAAEPGEEKAPAAPPGKEPLPPAKKPPSPELPPAPKPAPEKGPPAPPAAPKPVPPGPPPAAPPAPGKEPPKKKH